MFTINIKADVHIHDHSVVERLVSIERKVDGLGILGEKLMKAAETVNAFLDQLNTYTNGLAAEQAKQTAAITDIKADVDALLAAADADLPEDVKSRLEAVSAGLAAAVAFETAQSETLAAIAAQSGDPLPTPVEPEPTPTPEPAPEPAPEG